ncbi:MAG: pimeloyl-ACP methyl ester carboxylesterase [Myxococcota bacterium]|jgi:pimeloyl-ACP methyl ester carboxylesterase
MARAQSNGINIEYEETGSGEPLVLIMGIGTQLVHWPDRFVGLLADSGFRVIRFDNRDMGKSSHLKALGVPNVRKAIAYRLAGRKIQAPYLLTDMAQDVFGLMDSLGIDRAHVAGISMGGMIAQTMAIMDAEAGGGRMKSLTSMMSSTGDRRYLVAKPGALKALLGAPPRTREESQARMLTIMHALAAKGQPLDDDELRKIGGQAYDRGLNPAGFARQFAAILASGSRRKALKRVTLPTLVIHGASDPLIPASAGRATARAIPNSRLEVIDGMGHIMGTGHFERLTGLITGHAHAAS